MESITKPKSDEDPKELSVPPSNGIFYYKMVAKTLGQYLSIYDGQTEYKLGMTMH